MVEEGGFFYCMCVYLFKPKTCLKTLRFMTDSFEKLLSTKLTWESISL